MRKLLELILEAEKVTPEEIRRRASQELKIPAAKISHVEVLRRSIDARSRHPKVLLKVEVYIDESAPAPQIFRTDFPNVASAKQVIIIGAGPAGLFAALKLIELGVKPIILERGKDVKARRRDLAAINKEGIVNPDSNYCFGEGGAGTYSDGKLYTRSDKRGNIKNILDTFVEFGASHDILIDAHPHIGTNKLPEIITSMRERIVGSGGEIHFETRVEDLQIEYGEIRGVFDRDRNLHEGRAVILATGHSARDIFRLLHARKIAIEAKPFALGVRIEHPQAIIDEMQYKTPDRGEFLPPASYSFVTQVESRGVYSFCMCPGGIIAPCATTQDEVVTNGWSPSRRNNPYANSGIVLSIELEDLKEFAPHGELVCMEFQHEIEQRAWELGGRAQSAPAQRMVDFVESRVSATLPKNSYQPGCKSVALDEVLPNWIARRLRLALKEFGKRRKGYFTNEAILVGVESRTSSPVRIPRDATTLMHPGLTGLYPCGEGAGYAGGIVSAAMDGQRVAIACASAITKR